MFAKQAFFLESQEDGFDIRKFCQEHRSVQWRPVGKSNYQVRFNDRESWIDAEAFRDNYRNKVLKELGDRAAQACNFLSPQEIMSALPSEMVKKWWKHLVREKINQKQLYAAKDVENLERQASDYFEKHNAVVSQYNTLAEMYEDVHKQRTNIQARLEALIKHVDEGMSITGLSKKQWAQILSDLRLR
jgi:hypothetical protein